MDLQIRLAANEDYASIRDFYYALTDAMENAEFRPGWERDVYPTQDFLRSSIANKELYVGETGDRLVSCMVVNHQYNEGYRKVRWSVPAEDSELYVIHALGVDPAFSGRGIARQMAGYVIDMAQRHQIKTVRLDVLEGNIPAERAYTHLGFTYVDTLRMFYEDTGWTNYRLFEFLMTQVSL